MVFSLFEVLVLIGVAQGFVIAGSIWIHKRDSISKVLLALVLTVFNFLCLKILLHTTGLWNTKTFRYFPLAFELAIQPLLWLYISSLTKSYFRFRKEQMFHFVPFALSITYSLVVYLAVVSEPDLAVKDAIANQYHFNEVKSAEDLLSIFSSILYWGLGLRLILRYRKWIYDTISDTDYPTYAWLTNVVVLMGILILGLAISIGLDFFLRFGTLHFFHWQAFFIYLAILIYYLGFRGYQLPEKKQVEAVEKNWQPEATIDPLIVPAALPDIKPLYTEKEGKVSEERKQQLKEAIQTALEVKELYLDPDLNLQRLAQELEVSPSIASAVINECFQKSFRNLVNEYRVEKVKKRLQDPAFSQFSIVGVAFECGFNSEASFYRIFKAAVGVSPKEYLKQLHPGD